MYYQWHILTPKIQNLKNSKVQNLSSTNMAPEIENSTPDFKGWVTEKPDAPNVLCEMTFRWGKVSLEQR